MTVGELDSYAQNRPDWSTDPALPSPRRRSLVSTLEFVRAGEPKPLASCGDMAVVDVEAQGLARPARAKLRNYARGVASEESAAIPRTASIGDALRDGEALGTLEAAIPKATLHHTMGTKDSGKQQFPRLVASGEVERFARYFRRSGAYLEAENGRDVKSYLDMVDRDTTHPDEFVGKLPRIRNYHRFLAPMLTTLKANLSDRSRSKPLLLILHTGSDHNGAFHRDEELQNLVQHPRNLSIMVEGATTLEALGGEAGTIARRYGQRGRIQQLMLAGHGSPRSMDMAGGPGSTSQAMDLENNRARTERFLRGLVRNMETGPNARIVLNACLTAADEVSQDLSSDPAVARREILDTLNSSPSLASRLQDLAPGRTVEGNVSSVPAGEYQSRDAAGNPTGVLHQWIPSDPEASGSDRGEYIEKGREAEGCMRAVVALWAQDKGECLRRVEARRRQSIRGWDDRVIHTFYDMIHAQPDNAALMNKLANYAAGGLSEFDLVAEQVPRNLYGISRELSPAEVNSIFTPLYPHAPSTAKLAIDQIWMLSNNARRASFLSMLATFPTTLDASPHLDMGALSLSMAHLLPSGSASAPTSSQMKLALWAVTGGRSNDDAETFLRANAGSSRRLSMPSGTTVPGLTDGAASEQDVLETLGLTGTTTASGSSGSSGPAPNLDLDGDGAPDIYVESITRRGLVTATWLNVRQRPELSAPRIDVIPRGSGVEVFGEVGRWYAVNLRGRVGFVHRNYLRQRSVA